MREFGMRHGTILLVEIPVRDLQRAADFYANVFRWSFDEDETRERWYFASEGRGPMGAITTARLPGSGGARLLVAVDDIAQTREKVIAHGGGTAGGPSQRPTGEVAEFIDPDGNHFWAFRSAMVPGGEGQTSAPTDPRRSNP